MFPAIATLLALLLSQERWLEEHHVRQTGFPNWRTKNLRVAFERKFGKPPAQLSHGGQ